MKKINNNVRIYNKESDAKRARTMIMKRADDFFIDKVIIFKKYNTRKNAKQKVNYALYIE